MVNRRKLLKGAGATTLGIATVSKESRAKGNKVNFVTVGVRHIPSLNEKEERTSKITIDKLPKHLIINDGLYLTQFSTKSLKSLFRNGENIVKTHRYFSFKDDITISGSVLPTEYNQDNRPIEGYLLDNGQYQYNIKITSESNDIQVKTEGYSVNVEPGERQVKKLKEKEIKIKVFEPAGKNPKNDPPKWAPKPRNIIPELVVQNYGAITKAGQIKAY